MDTFSSPSLVLLDLFVNILAHNLAEPAYDAVVAQLEYTLIPGDHGLFLRLKGFNHKLPVSSIVSLSNEIDSFEQTNSVSFVNLVASEPDRRPPGRLQHHSRCV